MRMANAQIVIYAEAASRTLNSSLNGREAASALKSPPARYFLDFAGPFHRASGCSLSVGNLLGLQLNAKFAATKILPHNHALHETSLREAHELFRYGAKYST